MRLDRRASARRPLTSLLLMLAGSAWAGQSGDADSAPEGACTARLGTAIRILGSGGPMHGEGRGSAAYVLRHEGRAVAAVDMGGDAPTAIARAAVETAEVDTVLISHFHPDHVSGLAEFLWGEMVADRKRPLTIVGPSGREGFPGPDAFLERQFGEEGVYPFMSGLFKGEPFELTSKAVDTSERSPSPVARFGELRVFALPVHHGRTPALAFRVDGPGSRVVFAGDQTARDPEFSRFSEGADVLIVHAMLTPQAESSALAEIVALPRDLGRLASDASVRHLVLGHLMGTGNGAASSAWSLEALEEVVDEIRRSYSGRITIASDGMCIVPTNPEA